jgi:hypothetical protein
VLVGLDFGQIVCACDASLVNVDDHVNGAVHNEFCVIEEVDLQKAWDISTYVSKDARKNGPRT